MTDPTYILLYVDKPLDSAAFYSDLLGRPPVQSSPGFVMFVLASGVKFGLWANHDVTPPATPVGGAELSFVVASDEAVETTHEAWRRRGLRIAQPPVKLDFGFTFVALDPDGHRLRVFAPAAR